MSTKSNPCSVISTDKIRLSGEWCQCQQFTAACIRSSSCPSPPAPVHQHQKSLSQSLMIMICSNVGLGPTYTVTSLQEKMYCAPAKVVGCMCQTYLSIRRYDRDLVINSSV